MTKFEPLRSTHLAPLAATLLLLSTPFGLAAAEEGGEEKRVHVIEVERVNDCDGDDCAEGEHRALFIDEDGTLQDLRDAGDLEWLDGRVAQLLKTGIPGLAGGGYLGIGMSELTPELRAHFGLPTDAGVMVSKVLDDSPAFRGGLLVGDVIYSIDGEAVTSGRELAQEIRGREEGAIVDLEVWREGSPQTLTTTLEVREGELFGHHARRIRVHCDDGENCEVDVHAGAHGEFGDHADLCAGETECQVRVECEDDGSCACSVNGASIDCSTIPGAPHSE